MFVYDAAGKLASEFVVAGQAPADLPTGTQYLTADHLGTTRVVTNGAGSIVERRDYRPFGEDILPSAGTWRQGLTGYGVANNLRVGFTGQLRDNESKLDYFGARYFSWQQGRFTSPDETLIDQHAPDPQSWNLYAYVRNNPMRNVDPTGNVAETLWDAFNIGLGVYSFGKNAWQGNWGDAALDAGGVVVDVAATIVPFVPGGAGAAIKAGRAADNLVDAAQAVKKVQNVTENAKSGKAFEQQVVTAVKKEQTGVVEQLTVKTQSGTRTKIDVAGRDASGNVVLTEAKGTATAPLTKNQAKAFPEIQQTGAVVTGKGKPGFPRGTPIPPTTVKVVRPNDLKNATGAP